MRYEIEGPGGRLGGEFWRLVAAGLVGGLVVALACGFGAREKVVTLRVDLGELVKRVE